MSQFKPAYIKAYNDGTLRTVKHELISVLSACELCPRSCGANRLEDDKGICNTGRQAKVSSAMPHFGEEPPLVGSRGSGTVFFTNCNLLCNFCQNYDISHEGNGRETDDEELAGLMLRLQRMGCHNINFVTPSHVVPQIISALEIAIEKGLSIPLVYNTSAYDNVETLRLLDGIIDIYMPDFKFWDKAMAGKTCGADDYPEIARAALQEMQRQVGKLEMDKQGIALKGLLVRHLVMPESLDETRQILKFIARKISPQTFVNVMPQYRPCGRAGETPEINRRLYREEFEEALEIAKEEGLVNIL